MGIFGEDIESEATLKAAIDYFFQRLAGVQINFMGGLVTLTIPPLKIEVNENAGVPRSTKTTAG